MILGIGEKPDGVNAVGALNIRAGGGDGFGIGHRHAGPGGKAAVLSHAELGRVAESRNRSGSTGNTGLVGDGDGRGIRDSEGARVAAVVIGHAAHTDGDGAVVDGLVGYTRALFLIIGRQGILQGEAVPAVEREAVGVDFNFIARLVALKAGKRLFNRRAIGDAKYAVLGFGDDVVAGGVRRLVRGDAVERDRVASLGCTDTVGGNALERDVFQSLPVGADSEAADRLFASVINLHAARSGELDGLLCHFENALDIFDIVAGGDVVAVFVCDLLHQDHILTLTGFGLAAGDSDGLDAVALGQAFGGVGLLGERCTVIDLFRAVGGDGQFALRHLQCTVYVGDIVIVLHIVYVVGIRLRRRGADDLRLRGDVIALAHQGLGPGDSHAVEHVAVGKVSAGIICRDQRSAVIDLFGTGGGDGDRLFRHYEGTGGIGYFIIIRYDHGVAFRIRDCGIHDDSVSNQMEALADVCLRAIMHKGLN